MIRHFFDIDNNDPTKADCGATDGLIRMTITNVNCLTCQDWHAARAARERGDALTFYGLMGITLTDAQASDEQDHVEEDPSYWQHYGFFQ